VVSISCSYPPAEATQNSTWKNEISLGSQHHTPCTASASLRSASSSTVCEPKNSSAENASNSANRGVAHGRSRSTVSARSSSDLMTRRYSSMPGPDLGTAPE
jgi:hypothetical protein